MEVKELLSFLGYDADKVKSLDEFKSTFEKDFFRPSAFKETDAYRSLQGELFGAATGKIKNTFKDFEVQFSADEIKEKPYTEVLSLGLAKLKDSYGNKIKELESKVGQSNDEAIKEWQTKYDKAQAKLKDYEGLLNTTTGEFEKYKGETENKFKSFKIDSYKKSVKEKFPIISNPDPLKIKGFDALLNESYIIDLDEDGETPIVKTSKGERIKSETTTGKFKTFEEVFEEEAKKAGLLQLTKPTAQTPVRSTFTVNEGNVQPTKQVYINPIALAAEG